jgi:mannose PTS system EIID component
MSRMGDAERSMFWRSFAVQASWNYRTLIGTGFAYALLPVLRIRYGGDPDGLRRALARHGHLFNSHPYLVPLALGAVARLELEGADAALVERFKAAVRGSLGSLGDRLVWAGWRPTCLLLALALFGAGAPWWAAAGTFLLIYNIGHVALRLWGLRVGLKSGVHVGERLRTSVVGPAQRWLGGIGPFLVGLLIPVAAAGSLVGVRPSLPWAVTGFAAAAIGLRFGPGIRGPASLLLAAFAAAGLLLGALE